MIIQKPMKKNIISFNVIISLGYVYYR